MNFRGRTQRSLDLKGRLMLSPEYRESLAMRMKIHNDGEEITSTLIADIPKETKLVLTTYDSCLAAFSWHDWLKLEEQFSRLSNPSTKVRAFRRLVIGGAEEQSIDSQGRIRLSADHREYAQLEKDVTIIGLITRFEIWNPTLLKSSLDIQNLDDVAEELGASGIDFAL